MPNEESEGNVQGEVSGEEEFGISPAIVLGRVLSTAKQREGQQGREMADHERGQ